MEHGQKSLESSMICHTSYYKNWRNAALEVRYGHV